MALIEQEYPLQFSVDYPDRPLHRLSTGFRLLLIIPIVIVLDLVSGGSFPQVAGIAGGTVVLATILMILFRLKYPRWWFDWNLAVLKLENRVVVFLLLMRDEYPSTDEEQSVHLELPYPDVPRELNRWLPLVKWLLAIPHYIVLFFLGIALLVTVVISWFAILFSGRYPPDLFKFAEGVLRWGNRVSAYAFILATDRYPPFRLRP